VVPGVLDTGTYQADVQVEVIWRGVDAG
jgi:hypothetical protein